MWEEHELPIFIVAILGRPEWAIDVRSLVGLQKAEILATGAASETPVFDLHIGQSRHGICRPAAALTLAETQSKESACVFKTPRTKKREGQPSCDMRMCGPIGEYADMQHS